MQKTIKLFTIILIISTILLLFTNCAAIFLPKHQNILFKTNSVQNEVYLDNYLIIKGIDSVVNVNKKGVRGQITVLRKGYKRKLLNRICSSLKSNKQIFFYSRV